MIEITQGFTSICAGSDRVLPDKGPRRPTGARVTVDFCRESALPTGQTVRAHYEFAGDGQVRTATGIATPTRVAVRWGQPVVFHYRLSHWIEPAELMRPGESYVRQRTEDAKTGPHDSEK
jgi:hypothetical protein